MGGESLAHRVGEAWRGGLLDDLLVPPLHRAVALAEGDDRAVPVAEHLHLHMARRGEVALVEDRAVAERRLGLAGCAVERVRELLGALHDPHAAAAATRRRLDEQREAELVRLAGRQCRDAGRGGDPLRLELVAPSPEHVRWRADPRQARLLDRLGERGALGEEPVAGVDERRPALRAAVTSASASRYEATSTASSAARECKASPSPGADGRDRADAEPAARREDAHRDLSAVRDEELRPALTAREPIYANRTTSSVPRASAAPPEQRTSTQASGSTEYAPSESARSTARARIAPSPNIASDAIAYPAPSATYGQLGALDELQDEPADRECRGRSRDPDATTRARFARPRGVSAV